MFDGLDEQMRHHARQEKTAKERAFEYLAILVISLVVFAGAFFGVRLLE